MYSNSPNYVQIQEEDNIQSFRSLPYITVLIPVHAYEEDDI
jgi:hypothetical protein